MNKAPIFLTCQKELDFGSKEDNAAMNNRLNKYLFKTLPEVNKDAARWITEHPMECIVWASKQCQPSFLAARQQGVAELTAECTGLSKDDKQAIMKLDLKEESDVTVNCPDTNENHPEIPQGQPQSSEDEEDDEILELLEGALDNCLHNVGKCKMIKSLIRQRKEMKKTAKQQYKEAMEVLYRQRQDGIRNMGVSETLLDLLPANPSGQVPTPLQIEIDERRAQQHRIEKEKEESRLKRVFESTWLREKERKMVTLQAEIEQCPEGEVKKAKQYLLSTSIDAIKAFHVKNRTPKDTGLELRRKTCIEMGLLRETGAHLVTSLYGALPLCQDQTSDSEEDESLFYTPKTPSYSPSREIDPTIVTSPFRIPESPGYESAEDYSSPKKKRKLNEKQKKLTKYFCTK